MSISYILPVKWDDRQPLDELTSYLAALSSHTDLIIVDGSLPANFQLHHRSNSCGFDLFCGGWNEKLSKQILHRWC